MELWVRSQDKKCLIKTNLIEYETGAMLKGATDIDGNYHILGKYKTKERALEVLDEIQELFEPTTITLDGKYMETRQLDAFVYEMPKE